MPSARSARWYTWLRPKAASLGVSDLGAISSVVLRRDGTQTIKGFAVLMIKRAPVAPNG